MGSQSALDQYEAKVAKARALAKDASNDLRKRAKELVGELAVIADAYESLTGDALPEVSVIKSPLTPKTRSSRRRATTGKQAQLAGPYAGKTISDAVLAVLARSKSGMGPTEIAQKVGGNRNSISVAMIGMVKAGQIKRAARGKYVVA